MSELQGLLRTIYQEEDMDVLQNPLLPAMIVAPSTFSEIEVDRLSALKGRKFRALHSIRNAAQKGKRNIHCENGASVGS